MLSVIKNVSSSTYILQKNPSLRPYENFRKILPSKFIYELILIKQILSNH